MKSVYIHIPFCSNICSYCDFTKLYHLEKYVNDYLISLEKEIKQNYQGELIETIYIGGGTPSCLKTNELLKLFDIIGIFNLSDTVEFTMECNVIDIDEKKLEIIKKNKVNRLSVGVQSFDEKILKYLNRNHTKEQTIKNILLAKKYFSNISIDLIYAIPNQTLEQLRNDLKQFLQLDIPHISTYSLMIEPHTTLKDTIPIDEDIDFKMYQTIVKILNENNYNHYEISNFSKKGYESKHNLTYWNNENYYGFGLAASGYIENIRYTNTKNIMAYINGKIKNEQNILNKKEQMQEEMFLGLRKIEGVSISKFESKYKEKIEEIFEINDLIKEKKLILKNNFLKINPKYIYLSNSILIRFVGD